MPLSAPLLTLQAAIRDARDSFASRRAAVLRILGTQLLEFAEADYNVKSRGETGSDGIRWEELAPSTRAHKLQQRGRVYRQKGDVPIGIETGQQLGSSLPGFRGRDGLGGNIFEVADSSVTVGYGRSYSEHFDTRRPLLPPKLPAAWQERLEELAAAWGEERISQALKRIL